MIKFRGMENENDYLLRSFTGNGEVRAFLLTSKNLVEEARKIHASSPIATIALGRAMSAALFLGETLKGEETLTLQFKGDGPLKEIIAITDSSSSVRGYIQGKDAPAIFDKAGHLSIGKALGKGTLSLIRDMHLKEPYISTIPLHSGEIADDLSHYFLESEQTPTAISLGVSLNQDGTVKEAGGFFVQLMPEASERTISILEENIKEMPPVTEMLKEKKPEEILDQLLKGLEPILITEKKEVRYQCNCSKERFERAIIALGKDEIASFIKENKPIETKCEFCNKTYQFDVETLKALYSSLK